MRIDELKLRVRAKLDELGVNDSDMMDIDKDNKELDTMIEMSAVDALRYLRMNADVSMLEGVDGSSAEFELDENLVGTVVVPSDFLRVKNIRLSSWYGSPSKVITDDSAAYLMQKDEYACGCPERPVVAILKKVIDSKDSTDSEGSPDSGDSGNSSNSGDSDNSPDSGDSTNSGEMVNCLELYKAALNSDTLSFSYIPIPKIESDDYGNSTIDVDPYLVEPFVYCVASFVAQNYGLESSSGLLETAKTLAGI